MYIILKVLGSRLLSLSLHLGMFSLVVTEKVVKMRRTNNFALGVGLLTFSAFLPVALPVNAQPNSIAISRNFRPDPIRVEGNAGGGVSLSKLAGIDGKCRGFGSSQPNHVIDLSSNFPMLDILAYTGNINDDLTMLIKGSNGLVVCADDENQRRNPQLSRRLPQGTYQVWVGVGDKDKSVRYSLSLSESPQK
jgi:hypothetical protein